MRVNGAWGWLVAWAVLAGCAAPAPSGAPVPQFAFDVKGDGNILAVSTTDGRATLDVRSSTGIGQAAVRLTSGEWPETMILQLHLRGLEQLRLGYGDNSLTLSVASGSGRVAYESLQTPVSQEQTLTLRHPFWLDVDIVSEESAPRLPLEQGFFQVTLPTALLREMGSSFSISWIDFYRG